MKAADTPCPGDLAVRVEPRHRRARRHRGKPVNLAADALLAEDRAPADAVEGDHAKWRTSAQRGEGVGARGLGGLEHRPGIALHDPHQGALRDLGDAGKRPLGEVSAADEAHLIRAVRAAQAERMGERKPRQPFLILVRRFGGAETLQVGVKRGPVVEGVDAVAPAGRHDHRLADPPTAVTDADAERRVRRDASRDHRVGLDLVGVELECPAHLEVVARAAPDERHRRAENAVRAADNFLLVAGQAVAQQQHHLVREIRAIGQAPRHVRSRLRAGSPTPRWRQPSAPRTRCRPGP